MCTFASGTTAEWEESELLVEWVLPTEAWREPPIIFESFDAADGSTKWKLEREPDADADGVAPLPMVALAGGVLAEGASEMLPADELLLVRAVPTLCRGVDQLPIGYSARNDRREFGSVGVAVSARLKFECFHQRWELINYEWTNFEILVFRDVS